MTDILEQIKAAKARLVEASKQLPIGHYPHLVRAMEGLNTAAESLQRHVTPREAAA